MSDISSYKESRNQLLGLYQEQKFWDAFRLVEDLLAQYPYSADLLVRRAMIIQLLDKNGDKEMPPLSLAIDSLNLAHELAPEDSQPCIELGHFEYAINDQPAEGLKYFRMAQRNAEVGLRDSLIGQVKCYLDLGSISSAKEVLQKLMALFPDDDEVKDLHYELED